MREMVIDSIRVSLLNYSRIVILKEKDTERFLPIWIGQPEAEAIAQKLQDMTPPRPKRRSQLIHAPLTHLPLQYGPRYRFLPRIPCCTALACIWMPKRARLWSETEMGQNRSEVRPPTAR